MAKDKIFLQKVAIIHTRLRLEPAVQFVFYTLKQISIL